MESIRERPPEATQEQLERLNVYLFEAEREAEFIPSMRDTFAAIRKLRIPIVAKLAELEPSHYRIPEEIQ
jgi:hypothetical protein